MKTIVVSTRKGGVGKTTLAVSLAWYLAESKRRTLLIDLDGQQNASRTLVAHHAPKVHASALFTEPVNVQALGDPEAGASLTVIPADTLLDDFGIHQAQQLIPQFVKNMQVLSASFDACVIDTPPSTGIAGMAAMIAGDTVVSPIDAETYSIEGIEATLRAVQLVQQRYNPRLKFAGILPSRVDGRARTQVEAVEKLVREFADLVLPAIIKETEAIAAIPRTRQPVWRGESSAAREHGRAMRAAFKLIEDKVFT